LHISFEFAPELGVTLASTGPASALEYSHWFEERAQVSVNAGYIEEFYTLFCAFTRDMGTPVFSHAFLCNVATELPDRFLIINLGWKGRVVGAIWAFTLSDQIYCTWGASLHDYYYDLRPNYSLFWNSLRYGCEQGYRHFDFGRSRRDSSQYEFKRRWGPQTVPLHQQWWPVDSPVMVDVSEKIQADAKFRLFVKMRQRLPVPLAQWLGPKLRCHLPSA
jgi:serine/alanine adding enzyme